MATRRNALKKPPTKRQAGRRPAPTGSGSTRATNPLNPFDVSRRMQGEEYVTPFLLFLLILPILAIIARLVIDLAGSRLVTATVTGMLAVSGAGLTYVTADEAFPRQRWTKVRATVSVAWLHLAVLGTIWWGGAGPGIARPWAYVLFSVGFELSLWWAIGALPAVRGNGHDAHAAGGGDGLAEALGLDGTTVRKVEDDPGGARRVIGLKLTKVTPEAVSNALDLIAVKAGVPRNGVRMVADPDDASTPSVVLVRKDILRRMPPWPGPSRPGASIMEPVRCGLREDATDLEAVRPGRHTLVGGATGAGKTEGAVTEAADIWTRCDVVSFWSDTVKPGQTLPDFAPAVARLATTPPGTRKLVVGLRDAVEYRAGVVKGRNWTPSRQLPAVHVHIEEGALVLEFLGDDFTKLVQTARSVGIFITISLQRPHGQVLDTNARAQLADAWCYGVLRDEDAAMVLTDGAINAGARPEDWGDKHPGYCYRESGPAEKHAMPARTWEIPPAQLRAHVAQWAPRMAVLDPGTARAMGGAWTDLTTGADYALAHGWHRDNTGAWTPPTMDDTSEEGTGVDTTDDDTSTTTPAPPSTSASTTPAAPVPGTGTTGSADASTTDDDDTTEAERIEERQMLAEARREADERYPPDPEIVDALVEAAADDDDPPEPDLDGDLWTGEPGPTLDRRGRVLAFAAVLDELILNGAPDPAGGAVLATDDMVTKVMDVPGWGSGQRPAMYRLIDRLVQAGEAQDRERGAWWVSATASGWLRRELADVTDSDDAEDMADAEV